MLFNSFPFLVFFLLVTAGYFSLPHRWRWSWLLAASCYFYSYFIPIYLLILGFTIVVDYFAGLLIERSAGRRRKWLLAASIAANVGVLAVFKYFNFFNANLSVLATFIGWNYPIQNLTLLLPIGLSFHTFQAMSYTIEVYRGRQGAERHFGIYALYVMFYPQLVAGPIERPQNLLHQFHERHSFDYVRVVDGLRRIGWGLFKKAVVADRLALVVNHVYAHPHRFTGPALLLATVFFSFQIFCDFSGYSDIALGTAQIMGFNLMNNFDRPYHARTIREFWQRWHISLSTWFRDYLYIPLGGNRVAPLRRHANIMVVFVVSGLWHGANWTYIIWGALHGAFLVLGDATKQLRIKLGTAIGLLRFPSLRLGLQVLTTFALASVAWIFFRANSVSDAWQILSDLGTGWASVARREGWHEIFHSLDVSGADLCLGFLGIFVVEAVHLLQAFDCTAVRISTFPWWLRWGFYYVTAAILFWGYVAESDQFIYFQF